jgi:hypothetical protein
VGRKVFDQACKVKINAADHKLTLLFAGEIAHIQLNDQVCTDIKYFIAPDDEDSQVSFVAFCVEPNDVNKLSQYSKHYNATDPESSRRYILVEFRSDSDFEQFITNMRDVSEVASLMGPECKLNNFEWYVSH